MSKYDLNKASDFQRAVVSPAANIASLIAGELSPQEWDLDEGSYLSDDPNVGNLGLINFHVLTSTPGFQAALSKVTDKTGRRKAKYLFPYRDGGTTNDLGRKQQTFELDILFFGNTYDTGLNQMLSAHDSALPGTLHHPIRGDVRCVIEDIEIIHASEQRKAAAFRVTFLEHNFDIGDIADLGADISLFKSILNNALKAFAAIDSAIATVNNAVALANSLKIALNALISGYKSGYAKSLSRMVQTFNPPKAPQTVQESTTDIQTIVPVTQGGNLNPDGSISSTAAQTIKTPNDPFASIPINQLRQTTQTALSTSQAINEVNALRVQLQEIIQELQRSLDSRGSLLFYDTIKDLKQSAILLESVLEAGLKITKARIISYTTPRVMSVREVAFANGIALNDVLQIQILNAALLSVNLIPKGTTLRIAK